YTTDQLSFVINELDSFQRYTFFVKAKDIAGNISAASNQVNVVTRLQGLFYKYYEGTWFSLPDFDALGAPVKSGGSANLDLGIRNRDDNFSIIWRGYIKITTAGNYTFETCSDDGSKLYIGQPYSFGATALVTNDFPHPLTCKTGTPTFFSPGVYPITIAYMELGSDQTMQLYWQNDAGIARSQVPDSAFADSYTAPGTAPAAPSVLNATATAYDRISLGWTDNSNNETGFEIVRGTSAAGPFTNVGTTAAGVTSFIDSGRNASTAYWYKVRAVGTDGESAYTGTANATTQAAPPVPSAPTVLNAQVVSSTAINLSWNDNSNNETSFEIYRSTGNNTNFRLITTVNGGAGATKNYSDAGLFANVRYYYKVRAIGVGGSSAYTNEANGKTLNTIPKVENVLDFTVSFFAPYVLELDATDPDGDVLTFSSDNLPPFAAISSNTNGTAQITFTPGFGDMGGYVFAMYVDDGNGGRDTTYLSMFVNENQPPTVNPINDITVNEGAVLDVPIVANDAEDPTSIGWTFTGLPSFV
ncbi:MAG TPA: PA14 domain-containing protein, partial [Chitinophagaceae bacterium]|nr:PA14 domain-containing protein [Chitinophagaceae bacterium]